MRVLYFECLYGMSGNMTVASLIDLGVPIPTLFRGLNMLGLDLKVNVYKTQVNNLPVTKFELVTDNDIENAGFIKDRVCNSRLNQDIKDISLKMLAILSGSADTKKPKGTGYSNTANTGDSIINCVAAAICLDYLLPDKIFFSMPFDAKRMSLTGFSIASALGDSFDIPPPEGRITCTGCGAGILEHERHSFIRASIINTVV